MGAPGRALPWHGQEHRRFPAISFVLIAEMPSQIPLFERGAEEDVRGHYHGKEQMARGHGGGCPRRDQESQHERMAYPHVKRSRFERSMRVGLPDEIQEHLAKPKQIEMVDKKAALEHQEPPRKEQRRENCPRQGSLQMPYHRRDRTPLPEDQRQQRTGD